MPVLFQHPFREEPRQLPERFRVARQQEPQFEWRAEDPLPHRHFWQHAVHYDCGNIAHATRPARTAAAATLAGEREKDRATASLTDEVSETEASFESQLEGRASVMRRNLTLSESALWLHLSGKRLGVAFRRQVPLGRYIVDFLAPSLRLIVEVDAFGVIAASRLTIAATEDLLA